VKASKRLGVISPKVIKRKPRGPPGNEPRLRLSRTTSSSGRSALDLSQMSVDARDDHAQSEYPACDLQSPSHDVSLDASDLLPHSSFFQEFSLWQSKNHKPIRAKVNNKTNKTSAIVTSARIIRSKTTRPRGIAVKAKETSAKTRLRMTIRKQVWSTQALKEAKGDRPPAVAKPAKVRPHLESQACAVSKGINRTKGPGLVRARIKGRGPSKVGIASAIQTKKAWKETSDWAS
jgi:hypothetical protein